MFYAVLKLVREELARSVFAFIMSHDDHVIFACDMQMSEGI